MARTSEVSTFRVNEAGETVPDEEATGPDDINADAWKAFDDLRAASAGTDNIPDLWVFKQPTDKNGAVLSKARLAQMFTVPVDECTLDEMVSRVRDEYMGTDTNWTIRAQVRKKNGAVIWSKLIDIYKKSAPPLRPEDQSKKSDVAELFAQMRQMQIDMEERFTSRMRAVVERAAPPGEHFGIKEMMAMFMQQQQFAQTQKNEEMKTLALLIQAMRPSTSGANDLMTMLSGMEKIKSVASDLLPESSDGESTASTIRALAPIATLAQTLLERGNKAAPATPALPNPNAVQSPVSVAAPTPATPAQPPPQVPGTAPTQPNEDQAKMIAELRTQLGALAEIAGNKPDVKEVTQSLLPLLPAEMDDMIFDTLSSDSWFERLCFIQGAIRPHKEWFTELRNEILANFSEVDPSQGASPNAPQSEKTPA